MKKLKKVLSLVLVLAMALSMFGVCASATDVKDYSDYDKITYTEAVGVLSGLGVLQGDDTGTFRPTDTLKRSEAAKVITYLKGLQNENVSEGTKFTDVKGMWAEKFITIAANAGIIAGMGDGTFAPDALLTGYQWEKMVLCALGYDAEIEKMVGANYEGAVADLAKEIQLLKGLAPTYDATKAITREEAAQIAFNGLKAMTVYYPLSGSTNHIAVSAGKTLGQKVFALSGKTDTTDCWGRPGYAYYYGTPEQVAYAWAEEPVASYETAQTECDIAKDTGVTAKDKVTFVTNGETVTTSGSIDPTSMAAIGGQGAQVEVYKQGNGPDAKYTVVRIDTYLAKVTAVVPEKLDKNGHVVTEAYSVLAVYNNSTVNAYYVKGNDYGKDSYVLVNICENDKHTGPDYVPGCEVMLTIDGKDAAKPTAKVLGLAESKVDSQSKIYTVGVYNKVITREIGSTAYPQACQYNLDTAGYNKGKFVWFFDQFGNVIGSVEYVAPKSYAVLESMIYVPSESTAKAVLRYPDETEATVSVGALDRTAPSGERDETPVSYVTTGYTGPTSTFGNVSDAPVYNAGYLGYALYEIVDGQPGTVNLITDNIGKLDNATIYTEDGEISRDCVAYSDGDCDGLYATKSTVFIVREKDGPGSYKYVNYTLDTLPMYAGRSVDGFYLDEDKDGFAEIVYVKDAVEAAEIGTYVFLDNDEAFFEVDKAARTWHVEMYVDGVKRDVMVTDAVKEKLQKNINKLFAVEFNREYWIDNPAQNFYGYISDADEVKLINEEMDDYDANYITGGKVKDNILVDGYGTSYKLDYATIIGAEALTSAELAKGVWVVTDYEGFAETIYVGEKLDVRTDLTITYNGEKVTGIPVTAVKGENKAILTFTATHENAVIVIGEKSTTSTSVSVELTPENDGVIVQVWSEEGKFATYNVKVEFTPNEETKRYYNSVDGIVYDKTTYTYNDGSEAKSAKTETVVDSLSPRDHTYSGAAGWTTCEDGAVFYKVAPIPVDNVYEVIDTSEVTKVWPEADEHDPVSIIAARTCVKESRAIAIVYFVSHVD